LHPALGRVVDGYYRMFVELPVMRDIWHATQADLALQKLDEEDTEFLAGLLTKTLKRLDPEKDMRALARLSRLTMQLIAAAVRPVIALERREAERTIALFKQMLPKNLLALA
jgi:hypothetical protein